ncbi:MAG: hypothetical protein ABL994_22815 [Verrucomicrobiales bacterium]
MITKTFRDFARGQRLPLLSLFGLALGALAFSGCYYEEDYGYTEAYRAVPYNGSGYYAGNSYSRNYAPSAAYPPYGYSNYGSPYSPYRGYDRYHDHDYHRDYDRDHGGHHDWDDDRDYHHDGDHHDAYIHHDAPRGRAPDQHRDSPKPSSSSPRPMPSRPAPSNDAVRTAEQNPGRGKINVIRAQEAQAKSETPSGGRGKKPVPE